MNASWFRDWQRFQNETLPKLKEHGMTIGSQCETNQHAADVIKWYSWLTRRFDPLAHHTLCESLTKWEESQAARKAEEAQT